MIEIMIHRLVFDFISSRNDELPQTLLMEEIDKVQKEVMREIVKKLTHDALKELGYSHVDSSDD